MKKIISILFLGILFSCGDDYLDVNTDPNNPTSISPDLSLPVAQNYTARWIQTDRRVNHLGNMIMYNWSESGGFSWYNNEFQYLANSPTFYNGIFDDAYRLALKQYQDLSGLGDDYTAYEGISLIMKAYTYQILVDFYGDIPYTEALQRGANATPAYDDGQDVYEALIVDLTNAIDLLTTAEETSSAVIPDGDDTMFGGDLTAWKQFANSIKLRILTRMVDMASMNAYITTELAAIATEGSGYISADVGINPGYAQQANQQNPIWEDFGADETGAPTLSGNATCASDYILQYLQDTNDPRINFLFEEPTSGHRGVQQGVTSDPILDGPGAVSNIGPGILIGDTQDAIIMTVAETQFNLAELALKGFGGDPETFYNAGIAASFATLGAGSSTAYAGQSLNNVSYANSTDKEEAIITQKWIAMNGITAEQSWFDWSRTGFPADLPVSVEIPNLVRPMRLAYPASEEGSNADNVPDSPNAFTTGIFWAQ